VWEKYSTIDCLLHVNLGGEGKTRGGVGPLIFRKAFISARRGWGSNRVSVTFESFRRRKVGRKGDRVGVEIHSRQYGRMLHVGEKKGGNFNITNVLVFPYDEGALVHLP